MITPELVTDKRKVSSVECAICKGNKSAEIKIKRLGRLKATTFLHGLIMSEKDRVKKKTRKKKKKKKQVRSKILLS